MVSPPTSISQELLSNQVNCIDVIAKFLNEFLYYNGQKSLLLPNQFLILDSLVLKIGSEIFYLKILIC